MVFSWQLDMNVFVFSVFQGWGDPREMIGSRSWDLTQLWINNLVLLKKVRSAWVCVCFSMSQSMLCSVLTVSLSSHSSRAWWMMIPVRCKRRDRGVCVCVCVERLYSTPPEELKSCSDWNIPYWALNSKRDPEMVGGGKEEKRNWWEEGLRMTRANFGKLVEECCAEQEEWIISCVCVCTSTLQVMH